MQLKDKVDILQLVPSKSLSIFAVIAPFAEGRVADWGG